MLKKNNFFARGWSFVKKQWELPVAISVIIIISIFHSSISVGFATLILKTVEIYGITPGYLRIILLLVVINLAGLAIYALLPKWTLRLFKFFEIEIDELKEIKGHIKLEKNYNKKKIKKMLELFSYLIVFLIGLPPVFVICLKHIQPDMKFRWLVFHFILSMSALSSYTIFGSKILGSDPFLFYLIMIFLLIFIVTKKIKRKLKESAQVRT